MTRLDRSTCARFVLAIALFGGVVRANAQAQDADCEPYDRDGNGTIDVADSAALTAESALLADCQSADLGGLLQCQSFDVSGNGLIQANDVGQVRSRQGDFLPAGDPLPPPALPALAFAIYGAENETATFGRTASAIQPAGRGATRPDVRLDLNSLISATEAILAGLSWVRRDTGQHVQSALLGLVGEFPLDDESVEIQLIDLHAIFRQRTSLIGADHRRAPKGLHGCQVLDQGVAFCHALTAHGER